MARYLMLAGNSVDLAHLDIFHTEVAITKNDITHQRTNEDSIDQITFTEEGWGRGLQHLPCFFPL